MREEVEGWGWNSDIKAVWGRLEGHGWDGKATKMKKQGRVVGMEDSGRKKRLQPGHRAKKSKKHKENDRFFTKSTFPLPFSTKIGSCCSERHTGSRKIIKSIHFL